MDVDSADASKGESKNAETEAEPVEPLPEIEIYVMLLVMVWLLDQGKLKEVSIPDWGFSGVSDPSQRGSAFFP